MANTPGWQGSEAEARAKEWYRKDLESTNSPRWIWVWWALLGVWTGLFVAEFATQRSLWLSAIGIAVSASWLVRYSLRRSRQTGGSIDHHSEDLD